MYTLGIIIALVIGFGAGMLAMSQIIEKEAEK